MGIKRQSSLPKMVLERDKNTCQCCGSTQNIEAHHINPIFAGGSDEVSNAIALCSLCHSYAPNNPDDFFKYQKIGGVRGAISLACQLRIEVINNPATTVSQFLKEFDEVSFWRNYSPKKNRSVRASISYGQMNSYQKPEPRVSKASIDRQKVIDFLRSSQPSNTRVAIDGIVAPEVWFTSGASFRGEASPRNVACEVNRLAHISTAHMRLDELQKLGLVLAKLETRKYRNSFREFKVFKVA